MSRFVSGKDEKGTARSIRREDVSLVIVPKGAARWSRREFLQGCAIAGAVTLHGALLAGCNAPGVHMGSGDTPLQENDERMQTLTRLSDVNTGDLRGAIALGCQTMGNVFNSDDHDIPHFQSTVFPQAEFSFNDSHTESHVPGRHLNALLMAESIAGIAIPESVIEKHANALFYSFGGALPFPLNRERIDGPLVRFLPHNLREGLHGLHALIAGRKSERGMKMAEKCITTILDLWRPNVWWDERRIAEAGVKMVEWAYPRQSPFITGIARAIGPLVKIYSTTGYAPALELATTIKDVAIRNYFAEEGAYSVTLFGGHVHSTTCTLSGLAQLAELTGDNALMERVWAFYTNGLKEISDQIGWSYESAHIGADPDLGEANNTGDIVETALILGRWGKSSAFEDAERILRCHLLPSQLRDISFITNPPNPHNEDRKRNVAERHRGAFGFPAPYGHKTLDGKNISFNMDIAGGAVASLCAALDHSLRSDDAGHHVNMLFDNENDALAVVSPYTHDALEIQLKVAAPVTVRLPSWIDRDSVHVENAEWMWCVDGGAIVLSAAQVDNPITVHFPLVKRMLTLEHRTRDIRVQLRGDSVISMDNFGADLTFFDPLET